MTAARASRRIQPASGPAGARARRDGKLKIGKVVIADREERPDRHDSFARKRIRDVEKLIRLRHGEAVPEHDDPSNPYVFAVVQAASALFDFKDDQVSFAADWCERWCPWISEPEKVARAIVVKFKRKAGVMRADKAGALLRLTLAERDAARIVTISPAEIPPAEWATIKADRKRERDRQAAAKRRAKAGATARVHSIASAKPWVREGISQRTWWRRKAALGSNSSPQSPQLPEPESEAEPAICDVGSNSSSPIMDKIAGDETLPMPAPASRGDNKRRRKRAYRPALASQLDLFDTSEGLAQ